MTDIKSMTQEEITDALRAMGEPAFRGKQVFSWLHKGATDFAEMNNLSKPLREKLGKKFTITAPTVARKQVSRLDGTVKYLWELRDGNCIETVLMSYHHGNTVCISSQVGCRMGCKFCASTIAGKVRDLTPSEMLDQVLFTQLDSGKDISNIVLMGIGEPLDNRANVLRFLQLVNHPEGLNIGMRHISLSTCGVVPGIDALAEENLQLTLSVSLHAPDSATRSRIMPVNNAYDVEELFAACHDYFQKTGRRISFEYAMLDGGTEVYTVDGSITSSLDSELLDLMELPQLPDLDEKNITSAQLELTDGTVRQLTSAVETRETEVETETGETDENREPIYETTTETEEITLWSLDGQPLPEGTVGLEDWLYDLSTLYLDSCSAFKADQEELSACGMDGASLLTVSLTSGETFTLAIGGQTEDGSYVYAALEAPAPGCDLFLISADKARTLSDLNYESLSADEEAE